MKSLLLFLVSLFISSLASDKAQEYSLGTCNSCIAPTVSASPLSSFCGTGTYGCDNSRYDFAYFADNSVHAADVPGCTTVTSASYTISLSGTPYTVKRGSLSFTLNGSSATASRSVWVDFDTSAGFAVDVCMTVDVTYQGGNTCSDTECYELILDDCCP
ncbi:MAG: hypothetical protein SFU99_11975 [Saprospiraceae bacterium]|nr:hypothetical protein [Saprospiraceae bacterium]